MNFKEQLYNEILPQVERPSRYLGNELHSVHKSKEEAALRICLFFPDLYELGLGNLGLHILYAVLNDQEGVWAERGYSPAPDMEALLRSRQIPLFMYESKDPLVDADLVGFTLQSELTYTNVVNALDLAGIPLRSAARGEQHPLIFAGGPGAYNPEPLAPFIDFFVIGDGEDAILEIVQALRPLKNAPRQAKLEAAARIEGVYAPALYPVELLPDGQVAPALDGPKIRKRLTRNLDTARYPANYIVPFTQLIHDGVSLEVLRGCTHGCRFCQGGVITRPVRERSLETIDALMRDVITATGLDTVSLISLSTCDYSRVRTLVRQAARRAHAEGVSVSLPSLRLDSFAVELADSLAGVRRSGLTFAPEAATARLRSVINKFIPDEDLIDLACEAYRRGWGHIKTYFMIGLPTETDEDVAAIADLCLRTLQQGRKITNRAMVHTGVSTFVPKPFTPFQWAAQIGLDETVRKQRILSDAFHKNRGIKFGRHLPESSFVEGLIARADRRCADLIEAAWRHGARLDTWDEQLNFPAWQKAIEETGFDVAFQFRERALDERLPWDHIDVLIPKTWFQEEWRRAMEREHARDCRYGKCNLCGIMQQEPELCRAMLNRPAIIEQEATTLDRIPAPPPTVKDPLQRIRLRIGRKGEARFLSHLEFQNAWIRAFRRAHLPVAQSQGFHAHPRISLSTASPVGEESEGDYLDVLLEEFIYPDELLEALHKVLPPDLLALEATDIPLRGPSLMSLVDGFEYTLHTTADAETLQTTMEHLLAQNTLPVQRRVKDANSKKNPGHEDTAPFDIRPLIEKLRVTSKNGPEAIIEFNTRVKEGRHARPKEIIALLGLDPTKTRVIKRNTRLLP